MIITISGVPGAGKTTVGKILAKKLGYEFFSMGDIRGRLAKERGLDINQLNKIGEKEDWTDRKTDEYQKKLGKRNNIVVESRLAYHFIPHSVKIFLEVDPKTGAERVMKTERDDERYESIEETMEALEKRMESDRKRYKKYYGIDFPDKSKFDLVIDTTDKTPEQVVNIILDFIKNKYSS
ncbi:MAG: hypothetical protein DRP18_01725 [Candidatus Aenigmatarchaeota archaeon]|nr:MAG: hypothetical protein DRP18_01725 [Candidatus Aenigmarchaeota archaeon]